MIDTSFDGPQYIDLKRLEFFCFVHEQVFHKEYNKRKFTSCANFVNNLLAFELVNLTQYHTASLDEIRKFNYFVSLFSNLDIFFYMIVFN